MSTGRVTLPAESGQEKIVIELAQKWGADVLRDSDGTVLSQEILDFGFDIYSTLCIVRADQDYPKKNPTHLPQQYLMSQRAMGDGKSIRIELMQNFCSNKYKINDNDSPSKWWEVINRTTGEVISPDKWEYSDGSVIIDDTQPCHEYTVNFLVYQTWDSTSMYNHLTNGWTCDKIVALNPFIPEVYEHLMDYFDKWLAEHPATTVVRFTTFAYMFMILSNADSQDFARDWTGYSESVSPAAMQEFERTKGYAMCSEDFVDNGFYNVTYRKPSQRYLEWIEFIHEFVVRFAKDLVDKTHAAGKKAAMFWGDHWIGVEPYLPTFQDIGIDIHIGAGEDGCALRRIADAPGEQIKELRLYPYFFKDTFHEGGNPLPESKMNWRKIRQALLRKPIDRIGWGGYLSLAKEFPDFVEHLADIANEFRDFCDHTQGTLPWAAPVNVAVLTSWGKMRSWSNHLGTAEKFYIRQEDIMAMNGTNIHECLAGLPVNVSFISFKDIQDNPSILDNVDVIINDGDAGTAWQGGDNWNNPVIIQAIRQKILNGSGFIGIGDATAYNRNGRYFQLADIMGVEKEISNSIHIASKEGQAVTKHFITAEIADKFQIVNPKSFVFCDNTSTQLIDVRDRHVHLATNEFYQGRSVYISSLPWSLENARMLYRAILWAAQQETCVEKCFTTNSNTSCAFYPEKDIIAVANNTDHEQTTEIYDINGQAQKITLRPGELHWLDA